MSRHIINWPNLGKSTQETVVESQEWQEGAFHKAKVGTENGDM